MNFTQVDTSPTFNINDNFLQTISLGFLCSPDFPCTSRMDQITAKTPNPNGSLFLKIDL